jgi:MFS family permease
MSASPHLRHVDPIGSLRRRLAPLFVASFLQSVALWVPVEKLFMSEIGFNPASVGVMAAVYAGVVPFLEVPSGILADRWSRRNVLIVANIALVGSVAIGAFSTSVATYMVAALVLGVFFAMNSGTVDSIVYDTVVEETGTSDVFETTVGRVRFIESAALVVSALVGGWLATITSPRLTYVVTLPFGVLSIIALSKFREPRLHKSEEPQPLRSQIATTYRTILERGGLRPVIALMVLTALMLQAMLEFGPLWMVALAAPAILYGPHWAGLTSALGLGGLLAGRVRFNRATTTGFGIAMVLCSVVLVTSHVAVVVIAAQVSLVVAIVTISVFLTGQLHAAIPSTIRAGVASGIGTLTWIAFLPFALLFGAVSNTFGVHVAGWLMMAVTAMTAVLLVRLVTRCPADLVRCTDSAVLEPGHTPEPVAA